MELSPETINSLLNQGIALAYKIVPSLVYALLFYLVGKFLINKFIKGFTKILEKRDSNTSTEITFLH